MFLIEEKPPEDKADDIGKSDDIGKADDIEDQDDLENTPLQFRLLEWQRGMFADKTRFKVVVAGRRCGKTRASIIKLLVKGLECPASDAAVMYVAPTQGQARVLCWDLLNKIGVRVIDKANINNSEVTLINGVKIYVRGADSPDSLRGMKLYYCVLDEFKDMKPQVWELIIRPSLSDMRGGALFIGSPEPGDSLFREYYDRGLLGEDKEWKSWHLTTYDNELIAREEIESAKRSMSTFAFSQEYMASFDSMGQNIFKEEWLKYGEEPRIGDYYIAVDPAGFEAVADATKKKHLDNTAIAVVKITDEGKWWVKKIEYGRWDVRETAVRILNNIRTYKPMMIGIERGPLARALMPYLSDLSRKNNIFAHIEQIAIGGGSKINRITYNLQGLFEHGRISLNPRENWDIFKKELFTFPSPKSHDDCIDSLSLVANLVSTIYAKADESEEWEPIDVVSGI